MTLPASDSQIYPRLSASRSSQDDLIAESLSTQVCNGWTKNWHLPYFTILAQCYLRFSLLIDSTLATTSTTTGAHLLVSGSKRGKTQSSVLKYDFKSPSPEAKTLEPVPLGEVWTGTAGTAATLGGD